MITVSEINLADAAALLRRYHLQLHRVTAGEDIPGSYWGECEAGIIGSDVYVRDDTPVHSMFHEAAHLIVLPANRRALVHTDATDSQDEEDAVCLLQVLLAEQMPQISRGQAFADIDAWGYTFRLGSARAYFEQDADEAWKWLQQRGLVDRDRQLILR